MANVTLLNTESFFLLKQNINPLKLLVTNVTRKPHARKCIPIFFFFFFFFFLLLDDVVLGKSQFLT